MVTSVAGLCVISVALSGVVAVRLGSVDMVKLGSLRCVASYHMTRLVVVHVGQIMVGHAKPARPVVTVTVWLQLRPNLTNTVNPPMTTTGLVHPNIRHASSRQRTTLRRVEVSSWNSA